MKKTAGNNQGPGAWILGSVASLMVAASALGQYSVTQPAAITINDNSPATPYPSKVTVSGLRGSLEKATVTLNNLNHQYANDVDVLLVSPNGDKILLMANAGGGQPVRGANVTFDAGASASIPQLSAITSGSFKPGNYAGSFNFFSPAPVGPYSTDLTTVTGVNGDWSLYVQDNSPLYTGSVDGGWTLNLWTSPSVGSTNNTLTVDENGSGTFYFFASSSTTNVDNLIYTATADNTIVTNFVFGGSGTNRTLTVFPNTNKFGTTDVTITVSDGVGGPQPLTFTLTVRHINQPPLISLNTTTLTTLSGIITTNVVATISDPDPGDTLTLNFASDNTNVVSTSGIIVNGNNFAVLPAGSALGTANITVWVSDGTLKTTNSSPVTVTVNATGPQLIYANSNRITLPGPSDVTTTLTVANVPGLIGKMTVSLEGLLLVDPSSLAASLFGPHGQQVNLINGPAPIGPRIYGQLTFADAGNASLPTANTLTNILLIPSPDSLSSVIGTDANGTWTLVLHNTSGAASQISAGWLLNIYSAPTITGLSNTVTMAEETTTNLSFAVAGVNGATVTNLTATAANSALLTVASTLNGNAATLSLTGKSLQYGSTSVSVIAKDNNGFTVTNQVAVNVTFVNHAPSLGLILRQVTRPGVPITVPITVTDPDQPAQALTVTARSDNAALLPNNNIVINPVSATSVANRTLTLFPQGIVSDTANVTVTVSDGTLSSSQTFVFFVQDPGNPIYAGGAVTINGTAPSGAVPYPSSITVSGLTGTVAEVQVTLSQITQTTPDFANVSALLVSPAGQKVMLVSGAGGANATAGTTLVFADTGAVLPQNTALVSGTYKPADYSAGAFDLPAPAPVRPYANTMATFAGSNPNGVWKLYVLDNASGSRGIIAGGWTLNIRTAPNVAPIAAQTVDENSTLRLTVIVGDNQPGVNLTVTAVPTDTTLITPIAVSGSGATRTLQITPALYKTGVTTITVTATDQNSNTSSTSFQITVRQVNLPPIISTIAAQTTPAGVPMSPVSFTVWDPQGSALTVVGAATDKALVPDANIPPVVLTGTSNGTNSYTLTLLPAGVLTGNTTITVTATDGVGQRNSTSFALTVTPNVAFANTAAISIPEGLPQAGTATPYPSVLTVSNVGGVVASVTATLVGLSHPYPQDLDILLVSPPPSSKAVMLMAHAGAGNPASNLRINFSDDTANPFIPFNAALASTTYRPTNYAASDFSLPGAPAGPYTNTTLSAFAGINPNGDWRLYVLDDTYPQGGSISGGWILYFNTAPTIAQVGAQSTVENAPLLVPITISDSSVNPSNLTVTAVSSGNFPAGLVPNQPANLTLGGYGANRTLLITPAANLPSLVTNVDGTNLITVTVTDPAGPTATMSFPLTVRYVNQFPTVSVATPILTNQWITLQNTATNLTFNVMDVDSNLSTNGITVTSSDQTIVASSGIQVTATNIGANVQGTVIVKLTPVLNAHGTTTIGFSASDGLNTTITNLTLNVIHVHQAPTIALTTTNTHFYVPAVSQTNIGFTVGSVEVSADSLEVTASSSATSIVPNNPNNIILSGTGTSRSIQIIPLGSAQGDTTITLTVKDSSVSPALTSTTNFTLTVQAPALASFANTGNIRIKGTNAAPFLTSPYPSKITVAGLVGKVFKTIVTLQGFSNTVPANVDILLVAPNGTSAILMSGAGGPTTVGNLRLVFDDTAALIPSGGPLTSGTYHPANYTSNVLPSPAPAGPYLARMSVFSGIDPNGEWSLYVNDRVTGDFGAIEQGWTLSLQTTPTITVTAKNPDPLIFPENSTATIDLTVSDTLTTTSDFTAVSDNPRLLPSANVVFTKISDGNFRATLNPVYLQFGTNNLAILVTRNGATATTTNIPMSVTQINIPPTITRLPSVIGPENSQTNIQFIVADVDSPLSTLSISADSGNKTLIGNSNLVFAGSTSNVLNGLPAGGLVTLNLMPNTNQTGSSTITLVITDPKSIPSGTNTLTTNFVYTAYIVTYPPTISAIGAQSVVGGDATGQIPFTVNSVNSPAPLLSVTGTSSDQALVKNSSIVVTPASGTPSGGPVSMTVKVTTEPGAQGTVSITLRVVANDGSGSTSTTFPLNIVPTREHVFSSSSAIQIPISGPGTPYPATIDVSGLQGVISKVKVSVNGFAHTFPSDVGVMVASPSPNGTNVVLFNNAGTSQSGPSATNISLIFDQSASSTLPQGTLITGTYRPADYKAGTYSFPTPAPQGAYATPNLNYFNNKSPNGTWSLYVADFTPPDGGVINGGWSVAITTQPLIDGLVNVTNDENVVVRQAFTVADDSPVTPTYNWGGVSTDQNIVANSNIVVTGSGTNYTVTVTPTANAFGTTTNTITGTNAYGQVVTATFVTRFLYVNQPPYILPIPLPSQSVAAGAVASVPLNYGDPGVPKDSLIVTFDSSDKNLVPLSNIKLVGTNILIAPAGNLPGTSTITVTVSQPAGIGGLTTNASFALNVLSSPTPLGANTNAITINDKAAATPYPSTINIAGVSGNIVSVTATLVGMQHHFPSDISILLVGPQGQKVVLMSAAGDGAAVSNLRLTLDDAALNFLPQSQIVDGTYKPTDYKITDSFVAPAPAGPYSRTLSAFAGTNPNGTWALYVQDDAAPDGGVIAGGWLLQITTTSPIIQGVGPQITAENTPLSVPIIVSSAVTAASNLTVTATHNGDAPAGLVSTLAVNGTGTNRTLVITPGANLPSAVQGTNGTSTITVTVIDGSTSSTIQFPLTVTYVNQAPTITGLNDQSTPANQLLSVNFTINDPDDPIDSLVVSADTADHSIGTVVVNGTGNNRKLVFTPTGVTGRTAATVTVADATHTNTATLNITVTTASAPVLAVIPDQVTTVNVSAVVPLTVTDGLTPISSLSYSATATADTPGLVTGVSFNVSGTNATATIRVGANLAGTAHVTITVADANLATASQTFKLSVNPNPPILAPIPNQTTSIGTPVTFRLGITAGDVPIGSLNFSATSTPLGSSPQLVAGVNFSFDGVNEFATVNVLPNVAGSNSVSILVYDGFTTVSQTFVLTVAAPAPPVLGAIVDQSTVVNVPVTIALSVTSPDTAITNLSFSATSTNLDIVRGVAFSYSGGIEYATVNLVSNETGVAYITIAVTDGFSTSEQTFKLTVNEELPPTLSVHVVGNQLVITFTGAPNAEYVVQSTRDFNTWTDVTTITADSTGNGTYSVTMSGTGGTFYRVMVK